MSRHVAEVLDCPPPVLTPLFALYEQDAGESLVREQDKAGVKEPDRFASLVSSLRAGGSSTNIDADAWKHLSVTVLFESQPIAIVAVNDRVNGATTFAPSTNGVIALVTASAAAWRDAISGGVNDARPSIGAIFSDLYRKFCLRGYASLWKEFSAKTVGGRLLLEHK